MASTRPAYSFKWAPIPEADKEEKMRLFKKENSVEVEMVESVPGGIRMPAEFPTIAEDVFNFEARPKDVWIVTYPKCGTTWMTQICHMLRGGDMNFGEITEVCPWDEMAMISEQASDLFVP